MRSPRKAPRRIGIARAFAAAVVAAAAIAAGCGDEDEPVAEPLGEKIGGSVAQLAQCKDWVRGTEEEKLVTIEDIRAQVNRPDSGVSAPPLSDDEAMQVFDNACAEEFATGFRLYVLYARAAGFAPLQRELEGE